MNDHRQGSLQRQERAADEDSGISGELGVVIDLLVAEVAEVASKRKRAEASSTADQTARPRRACNLQNVPAERQCGAKTRAGTPCKNWGRGQSGRCRMHGGSSLGGMASPTFKHGWYSKVFPYPYMRAVVEQRERTERIVAARLEEYRARRAEKEARAARRRERQRIRWESLDEGVLQSLADMAAEVRSETNRVSGPE